MIIVKLFNLLKMNLLGKVESDFYTQNRALLNETNYILLKKSYLFSLCMCFFLFLLTFFNDLIKELDLLYLFFTLFFAVGTLIVFIYVKNHKNLSGLFFYVFAIAILFLAADIGTLKSPDTFAVTFYVFLIIIPMLHVGRPIYAIILSVGSCIVFCLLTYFVKSSAPQVTANDVLNAICCCIVGIGVNITIINLQLENLQTKVNLEYLSSIDELTSLPNRRCFNLYMTGIFANKKENISVIMMDIDNFKSYNDIFGHLKGDECLRKIGNLLMDIAKGHSLFVSRFGGEEFVAISTLHSIETISIICDDIMKKVIELNIQHDQSPFGKVTISIGYSDSKTTAAKSEMQLINYADKALYISKTSGKNCVTFYGDIC